METATDWVHEKDLGVLEIARQAKLHMHSQVCLCMGRMLVMLFYKCSIVCTLTHRDANSKWYRLRD